MASMITKKGISGHLSVRELAALLKLCPDQDAYVCVPNAAVMDNYRHDPFRSVVGVRATDSASVELIATPDASASLGAFGWY
jgi:hypothetical protein